MSSRLKSNSKKLVPSEPVFSETSEDDLLGKGDGLTKKLPQKILKMKPSNLATTVALNGHEKVNKQVSDVTESCDAENFSIKQNDQMNSLLAQLHKKDDQITKLTESVSCMVKEIQKLNQLVAKLQEQVAKPLQSTSSTSKGVQNVPFSKVLQPEGKKNDSPGDKTPFSKVPSGIAKKTVKFADVVKRNVAKASPETSKIEGIVSEIKASCWKGANLTYLLMFDSGVEKWIKASDCASVQGMVAEFHKQNPGAPNLEDYSLADSLKQEKKKKKDIMGKIKKSQSSKLQFDEIDFIAQSLVKEANKPKEFSKVAFSIANKRVFKGFTYTQKQATIKRIIHQYGLNQKVVRISLVGDSILELYTIKEEENTVVSRMKSNGWNLIKFTPEELPEFSSQKDEVAQKMALINRVAFLYAGTTLVNLRKVLLQDISEATGLQILARAGEILEKRTAIKEGRAQAKLVQKSEL
jgi:L-rhamnose mutarotase